MVSESYNNVISYSGWGGKSKTYKSYLEKCGVEYIY